MLLSACALFAIFLVVDQICLKERKAPSAGFPNIEKTRFMEEKPIIWYIPGFNTENDSQEEEVEALRRIFPGSTVITKKWKSNNDFSASKDWAENVAKIWAIDLKNMVPAERESIILVGHSLGGRIVIRIMAQIREWGLHIRQGILLGAAEDNELTGNEEESFLDKAMLASQLPMINIWNRQDMVLRGWYAMLTDSNVLAVGTYGYVKPYRPAYLRQYKCEVNSNDLQQKGNNDRQDKSENTIADFVETVLGVGKGIPSHFALNYLTVLEKEYPLFLEELPPTLFEMDPDVDRENWEEAFSLSDGKEKTRMEYNKKTEQYRVVSPNDVVICVGDKAICEKAFGLATEYDDSSSLIRVQNICSLVPGLSQRPQKIKIELDDQNKDWETVQETHFWLLQRSKQSNRFRIVDPFDFERAKGSEEGIRILFDQLEKALNPVSETGLIREQASMEAITMSGFAHITAFAANHS